MLKRLWQIFGPVFCGFFLAIAILVLYPAQKSHSLRSELIDATSLTKDNFKSGEKKVRALTDPDMNFVPFFGSSEWSRMDKMHPSVLAEAYQRSYRPYLLGQKGAASLTHFFGMQQMKEELKYKQAVYIISPQWFVRGGTMRGAFQNYISTGQIVDFLQEQTGSLSDRYAAKRYLRLSQPGVFDEMMHKVASGKNLSKEDQQKLMFQGTIFQIADNFFSQFSLVNNFDKMIAPQAQQLPKDFSYDELEKIASHDGQHSTQNNPFGIEDKFYNKRIKNNLKLLRGSQKVFNYVQSPEYRDFQLVLEELAENHTNVLFIIPPVNSKWSAFTGLNQDMYQKSVEKIKFQLESQGFTNIADFSKEGDKPYFMQDTIHMGWNGWIAMDKVVEPFLSQQSPAPNYSLNERFLSKEWAKYKDNPQEFK